jgi:hypothetical protein
MFDQPFGQLVHVHRRADAQRPAAGRKFGPRRHRLHQRLHRGQDEAR